MYHVVNIYTGEIIRTYPTASECWQYILAYKATSLTVR